MLALIGSLGAPRSLAATAVKMKRIAAVHHLYVYTVTPVTLRGVFVVH